MTGFFVQKSKLDSKPVSVAASGENCGFRAAVLAMISNILVNPDANKPIAEKLLRYHSNYFKQPEATKDSTRPAEHSKELMKSLSERGFINELAYAVRQVTVDELCANCIVYRGAFVGKGTAPEKLRQPGTWINEVVIAALSTVMEVPIKVREVGNGKEIPSVRNYNPTKAPVGSSISMGLRGEQYIPLIQLIQSEVVKMIQKTEAVVRPVQVPPSLAQTLPKILGEIAADWKRLLEKYENAAVEASELTKESLIEIHIKAMSNSDFPKGRMRYVDYKHFFEAIENSRNGVKPIGFLTESYDQQVIQALIHAIACEVSVGRLDVAAIYDVRESPQQTSIRIQ